MNTATSTALLDACAAAAGALEAAARIFAREGHPQVAKGLRDIYTELLAAMVDANMDVVADQAGRAAMQAIQRAREGS